MKLEEVLPAFREGKKIRIKEWKEKGIYADRTNLVAEVLIAGHMLDETWEIVEEKPIYIHDFEPTTIWGLNSKQILELKEFYLKHKGKLPDEN